jgi:hypothetical protein
VKFPRWVFTSPGATQLPDGSYGSELVENEQDYAAALSVGYSATVTEAMEKAKARPLVPFAVTESSTDSASAQLELETTPEQQPAPESVASEASDPPVEQKTVVRPSKRR